MDIELYQTEDGSPTLYNVDLGEHYHSVHGALQESVHIFLRDALEHRAEQDERSLSVLEVGFGTGLNALLTLLYAERRKRIVSYTTLERYPIDDNLVRRLNFNIDGYKQEDISRAVMELHSAPWGLPSALSPCFSLHKVKCDLTLYAPQGSFDVIYFDAFSPETQPELWEEHIFSRLYLATAPGGVLTTYCAKGEVRRRLQRVGYTVERLPGPKGKREILRATKSNEI